MLYIVEFPIVKLEVLIININLKIIMIKLKVVILNLWTFMLYSAGSIYKSFIVMFHKKKP